MERNRGEQQQGAELGYWLKKYLAHQGDWIEKTRGNLMVAATVIAAISFQVMITPPGGVWQDDKHGKAGTAVLQNDPHKGAFYTGLVISSTISFSASMSILLLVTSGLLLRNRVVLDILISFMLTAVLSISATFWFTILLLRSAENDSMDQIVMIYLGFWVMFPGLVLLVQVVRFLYWLICSICLRRPPPPVNPEDVFMGGATNQNI